MENSNGGLKLKKKKKKDLYPKLIFFKVWVHFYKSDEKSKIISKVFQKKKN
jgi:hypothetical protein